MRRIGIVLRILVGLAFVVSAAGMFIEAESVASELQLATWFVILVTVVKFAGAVGLLTSFWIPRLALPSALLFVAVMAGALVTHIRIDDPVSNMIPPAVLLVLASVIAAIAFWEDLELRDSLASRIAVGPDFSERRQTNA